MDFPTHSQLAKQTLPAFRQITLSVRRVLAEQFPKVDFSVMVNSLEIAIEWHDGPTLRQVGLVSKQFEEPAFHASPRIEGIHLARHVSDKLYSKVIAVLCSRHAELLIGCPRPTLAAFKRGELLAVNIDRTTTLAALIHDIASRTAEDETGE